MPVRLAPFRYKSYIADAVATECHEPYATLLMYKRRPAFYRAGPNPFRCQVQRMPTVAAYGHVVALSDDSI